MPRANALTRKLEREAEHASEWIVAGVSVFAGGTPGALLPMLEGLAYWHKDFRDGRHQTITLLIPGDTCGNSGKQFNQIDYGMCTLTHLGTSRFATDRFLTLLKNHPA